MGQPTSCSSHPRESGDPAQRKLRLDSRRKSSVLDLRILRLTSDIPNISARA
jgi:hypothetical protein